MFNEVNIDNRLRHPVRGRVIVFTDSRIVEFVDAGLTQSVPLWGQETAYPLGYGLVFSVELHGFLTFDFDSEYRVIEIADFVRAHFDPSQFAVVLCADPFLLAIQDIVAYDFMSQGGVPYVTKVQVFHDVPLGQEEALSNAHVFLLPAPVQQANFVAYIFAFFRAGAPWRGRNGYPGFTPLTTDSA